MQKTRLCKIKIKFIKIIQINRIKKIAIKINLKIF